MKTLTALLFTSGCLLLAACTNTGAPKDDELPIRSTTFTPSNAEFFAVVANANGEISVSPQELRVDLSGITFKANPKYEKSQYVESYSVCLAAREADKSWNTLKCSDWVVVKVNIAPGHSEEIPSHSVSINLDGISSLRRTWLVLDLMKPGDNTRHHFYSHSPRNLFEAR